MSEEKFDLWCMVELFGHNKIAGKCTEQNIAGVNMLRVDVPETDKQPAFTKFYNGTAIYAINPITEEVANDIANKPDGAVRIAKKAFIMADEQSLLRKKREDKFSLKDCLKRK